MKLRIVLAALMCGIALLAADAGAELFQKAVTQEQAAGNLEEAIKLYQRVAKEYGSNRPLAAKALIQAARCYEKLGQDKSVKLYEQVAHDYGDQRELAATASARLAILRQQAAPLTMTARKIDVADVFTWAGTDGQHVISRDGAGTWAISDLAGKNKRVFLKEKPGNTTVVIPSRDFSMGLLATLNINPGPALLAVIRTDGTGYREIGRVDPAGPTPSWSWDGRYILAYDRLPDGSAGLVKITVADGQRLVVLRSDSLAGLSAFSPDGRFIAYTERRADSSHVFVAPSQGGEPRLVSDDGDLVDWTHDGRYLAINRGTPNQTALYLLPVKDGQAAGAPVFIRRGVVQSGRTTAGGALVYSSIPTRSGFMSLATLDPDGRVANWKPLNLNGAGTDPFPSWSPDSSQILYTAGLVVHVRNIARGEDREIFHSSTVASCVWAARHPNLYCGELGPSATEMVSVNVDSGRVERLATYPGNARIYQPSRDDSALYLNVRPAKGVVKWDIATHEETPVGPGVNLSADERWVYTSRLTGESDSEDPAHGFNLGVRPLTSTEWRSVGHITMNRPLRGSGTFHVGFTADGNWIYFHDRDSEGKDALFRASTTAGGAPERMGDFPFHTLKGNMMLSPDGRKILVTSPDAPEVAPPAELWLLENFEPKQAAR